MQLIHEELALQWVVSNGPTREKAMSEAWFFFELMVKSMAEYLSVAELINAPRKQRFPSQFTDDCTALVVMITKEIVEKYHVVSNNNVQTLWYEVFTYVQWSFLHSAYQFLRADNSSQFS